jgi:hypothetical protein
MINLIFFILGCVGGWFLKNAFDYYHQFKVEDDESRKEMKELVVLSRAMVIAKEKEYKKYETGEEKQKKEREKHEKPL